MNKIITKRWCYIWEIPVSDIKQMVIRVRNVDDPSNIFELFTHNLFTCVTSRIGYPSWHKPRYLQIYTYKFDSYIGKFIIGFHRKVGHPLSCSLRLFTLCFFNSNGGIRSKFLTVELRILSRVVILPDKSVVTW